MVIAWYLPEATVQPPTVEPSLEPTLEPTIEVAATSTPEPTLEPTAELTPEATLEQTIVPLPTVSISADVQVGTAPLAVQFVSVVTDASEYVWDFGDGIGISLEASPAYTYTTSGEYLVTLIVTGAGGTASTILTITVQ